jgi:uncharacterized protein (TIGR02444 family)
MSEPKSAQRRNNPFWDFSLALYSRPDVQKACIDLQDGSGVDVNVLLYMLWKAANGCQLTSEGAKAVVAAVEPWRLDVVVPLRAARRNLKAPGAAMDAEAAEALRTIVKKAELEAERLQQAALYGLRLPVATASAAASARETATVNVAAYAAALGRSLAPAPLGVMLEALDAHLAKTVSS